MSIAVDSRAEAAERLIRAAADQVPCSPVRELIGTDDVAAAYDVQRRLTVHRIGLGGVVVGRKVGLTSPAVQAQLGVDRPDFGMLFADMRVADGATVPMAGLLQPRIEAEVAFVLGNDLVGESLDDAQVRASVAGVAPALEIVDSRIVGWDIGFADTVADNGSSALFVVGDRLLPLSRVEPRAVAMTLRCGDEVVSSGEGRDCLGDPLAALRWLANTACELGDPLRSGDVVLSGALGPMVPVRAGDRFRADITGLGSVSVGFEQAR